MQNETEDRPSIDRAENIPAELAGHVTVDVQTAARVLGVGRDAAYAAVRNGEIKSLRISHRIVIPVQPLLRQLGYID